MKILESRAEYYARLYEPKAKDPVKVLDLLIHLNNIGVQKFEDINFVEDSSYDEVIVETDWGKITFDYANDLDFEYTGDGDYDGFMSYMFSEPPLIYNLTMKVYARLKDGDEYEVKDYVKITSIKKDSKTLK